MWIPQFDYLSIGVVVAGVRFFAHGARQEGRSPFLWACCAVGAAMVGRTFLLSGFLGAAFGLFLLFAWLTARGVWKERRAAARRADGGDGTA